MLFRSACDGTAVSHVVCVDGQPSGTLALDQLVAGGDRTFGFEACWRAVGRRNILPAFWDPGGDEITPTMKLKRRPIAAKYAAVIESMYAAASQPA